MQGIFQLHMQRGEFTVQAEKLTVNHYSESKLLGIRRYAILKHLIAPHPQL